MLLHCTHHPDVPTFFQDSSLPTFTLLDAPPYANGDLHVGHAINKLTKDFILRYKRATGHRVVFR